MVLLFMINNKYETLLYMINKYENESEYFETNTPCCHYHVLTNGALFRLLHQEKHVREMCTPLKPHFYIATLGYAGVYLFFLFLLQNIDCGYSLEPPRRGGSNVYPQSMF